MFEQSVDKLQFYGVVVKWRLCPVEKLPKSDIYNEYNFKQLNAFSFCFLSSFCLQRIPQPCTIRSLVKYKYVSICKRNAMCCSLILFFSFGYNKIMGNIAIELQ
jgi:hypothetical protein